MRKIETGMLCFLLVVILVGWFAWIEVIVVFPLLALMGFSVGQVLFKCFPTEHQHDWHPRNRNNVECICGQTRQILRGGPKVKEEPEDLLLAEFERLEAQVKERQLNG